MKRKRTDLVNFRTKKESQTNPTLLGTLRRYAPLSTIQYNFHLIIKQAQL